MRKLYVTIAPLLVLIFAIFLIGGTHPKKTRYDYYYYNVYMSNGAVLKAFSCDPVMTGVYVNENGHLLHLSNSEVKGWEFVGKSKLPDTKAAIQTPGK